MARGVAEFQSVLVQLGRALDGDLVRLVAALSRFDVAEGLRYITDGYPDVATPYLAAAGDLSATWYEDFRTVDEASPFIAAPAELPPVEQLAANGRWALLQPDPANALRGSADRALFRVQRDTVRQNALSEGARWGRYASATACEFCKMLATRGAVYTSEQNALKAHDFCHCIAVPDRRAT